MLIYIVVNLSLQCLEKVEFAICIKVYRTITPIYEIILCSDYLENSWRFYHFGFITVNVGSYKYINKANL